MAKALSFIYRILRAFFTGAFFKHALNQFKMLQRFPDSILIYIISLVGAVFFDVAVGVTHGYTGTGVFQHGQVVGTVTEGEAVLQADGQAVQEKPDTGCLADALLDHLPDAVAVVKVGEMLFTETAEFLNLGIREHMYQEFVKGVGAGFFSAEFVNVHHGNLLAHFFSKGGLGR